MTPIKIIVACWLMLLSINASTQLMLPSINASTQKKLPFIKKVSASELRQLTDSSRQPMIINFWASWCGPCIREIPWFEQQVLATNGKVTLVLVSLDLESAYPKKLSEFVNKNAYKSQVLFLAESDEKVFAPLLEKKWDGTIPASIFIDNSKNYYRFYNFQLTEARLKIELENLLK